MKDPRQIVQKKVYELLTTALVSPFDCLVKDHEAGDTKKNVVVIGEDFITADPVKIMDDIDLLMSIHVYTRDGEQKGRKTNKDIQAAILETLSEVDLNLSPDFKLIDCRFDSATSINREEDLNGWHGVIQFNLHIQNISI